MKMQPPYLKSLHLYMLRLWQGCLASEAARSIRELRDRFWPLGIRLQLTCWYTGVLAIIILCSGAVAYKHLDTSLESTADTALNLRIQQIANEVSYRNGHIRFDESIGDIPRLSSTASPSSGIAVDVDASSIVRILDSKGRVLRATPAFQRLSLPEESLAQPLSGQPWKGTVKTSSDQEIRIASQALTRHGKPYAIVQVGESLKQLHAVLHQEVVLFVLLTPEVLMMCALIGSWLSMRAFAPIHKLAATARRIGEGDLQQRVPVPQPRDEVQFLAMTLNDMIERLDAAFKRQQRFVSDASHELRTPVAAIRSKTDVALLQDLSPREYVGVLQGINTEAERLSRLINDLLVLARADEGRTLLAQEPVQLDFLVKTVAANAEELAQERGITVEVQTPQPVTICGDEARLIQVVMNLLDNALIYTQAGGHVTLKVEQDEAAARIIVSDTGQGIAPEHLPYIFERFYRADPAHQHHEGGSSGLGLAIVDWVVRAHNGSVSVKSQPGLGSTFIVNLPRGTK
ncbi:HAMP domain-containing protein [Ktedonosporobacter rubrisoli]|uniref:histidine kinase n=1 Tax=Ktedonosporobacter rubrisoli TaxID=2509675 RepID=A0A4P6JYQ5_KTERU|nr:ATP-binding protein [Ktedonosporobacter rubrisoli]QBD80948.1 HAMP domain-containing protein [Ktedonosporobacter rubrisoli]